MVQNGITMLENGIAFAPLYEPIDVEMPQGTSSRLPEQWVVLL